MSLVYIFFFTTMLQSLQEKEIRQISEIIQEMVDILTYEEIEEYTEKLALPYIKEQILLGKASIKIESRIHGLDETPFGIENDGMPISYISSTIPIFCGKEVIKFIKPEKYSPFILKDNYLELLTYPTNSKDDLVNNLWTRREYKEKMNALVNDLKVKIELINNNIADINFTLKEHINAMIYTKNKELIRIKNE